MSIASRMGKGGDESAINFCNGSLSPFTQIPKKLHVIWVGDDNKRPDQWINTWKQHHPKWDFKLWGNAELDGLPWQSKRQMYRFRDSGHWEGVADLMRYEILYEHGGIYVDADTICVQALDDRLLDTRMFAVWESEKHRPGLIANTFIGSIPRHPCLYAIIQATARMNKPAWRKNWRRVYWKGGIRPHFHYEEVKPWKWVGPVFFTKMLLPFCPLEATILPSILFIPKHTGDHEKRISSLVYAHHEWGNTRNLY